MDYRVYIDEAGDRGHKAGSTEHFVIAAAIFQDALDSRAQAELSALKLLLGRNSGEVLHFRKLTHPQKVKLCQEVPRMSLAALSTVTLCKRRFGSGVAGATSTAATPFIAKSDPMYLWAVRLLLERVSWFVRDNGGDRAIVTFAHLSRFKVHKLHDYRRALELSRTKIHWPAYVGHPFRVNHPNTIHLLQVADAVASGLFRGVEPDGYGNTEQRYIAELAPALYRRTGNITSYGLKVFPTSEAEPAGPLAWLRGL